MEKTVRRKRSPAWEFYQVVVRGQSAKCQFCSTVVKTSGGTTTGLSRHLACHGGTLGALRKELELVRQGLSTGEYVRTSKIVPLDKSGPQPERQLRSPVWKWFVPVVFKETAKCNLCSLVVRSPSGATSGMTRHLQSRHGKMLKVGGGGGRISGWNDVAIKTEPVDAETLEDEGHDDPLMDDVNEETHGDGEEDKGMSVPEGGPVENSSGNKWDGGGGDNDDPAWEFFMADRERHLAICKICGDKVKTPRGSTTGLRSHLRKHGGSLNELRRRVRLKRKDFDFGGSDATLLNKPGIPRYRKVEPSPEDQLPGEDDEDHQPDLGRPVNLNSGDDIAPAPEIVGKAEIKVDPSKIVQEDQKIDKVIVDIRTKPLRRQLSSPVWEFFLPDRNRKCATCKFCLSIVKTTAGCTTGLRSHLRRHGGTVDNLRRKLMLKRQRARGRGGHGGTTANESIPKVLGKVDPDPDYEDPSGNPFEDEDDHHGPEPLGNVLKEGSSPSKISAEDYEIEDGDGDGASHSHENEEIQEGSRKRRRLRSSIWTYFTPSKDRQTGICKICKARLKTSRGSTTCLIRHWQSNHDTSPNRQIRNDMKWLNASKMGAGKKGIDWSDTRSPKSRKVAAAQSDSESDSDVASEMGGDDDHDGGGVSEAQMSCDENDRDEDEIADPLQDEGPVITTTTTKLGSTTKTKSQCTSQPHQHHQHHQHHAEGSCFICEAKCSSSSKVPQLGQKEYRFFLMEMLELPSGKSLSYLEQLETPEKWMAICKSCQDLIRESISTRQKIVNLQLQLEKYQGQVLKKIKANAKTGASKASVKKQHGVVQDIRKFVFSKDYSVLDMDIELGFSEHVMDKPVADQSQSQGLSDPDHGPSDCHPSSDEHDESDDDDEVVFYCGLCNDDRTYASADLLAAHTKERHPSSVVDPPPRSPPSPAGSSTSSIMYPPSSPKVDFSNTEADEGADYGHRSSESGAWLSRPVLCKSYQYRYSCLNCPQVKDYNVTQFVQHLGIHQRRPYQCVLCLQFFPADDALIEHHWTEKHSDIQHPPDTDKFIKIKFSPGKIYKCDSCLEGFFSEEERCQHERRCVSPQKLKKRDSLPITKQKPHACQLCDQRFRNFVEWRLHRALHHPQEDSMSCYYCHESFRDTTKDGGEVEARHELKMVNHMQAEHGTMKTFLECEQCGIVFNCGKDYKEHMMGHHGISSNQLFPCTVCELKYPDIWGVRRHMSRTHFQSGLSFCDLCGTRFLHEVSLLHHMFKTHGIVDEGQEILNCPREGCDFKSIVKGRLNRHVALVHEGLKYSSFVCRYCGKAFKNRAYFRQHEDIHKNKETKPFQCEICGSSFAVKNYLTVHQKLTHGGKKPSPKRNRSTFSSNEEEATSTVSSGYGYVNATANEGMLPATSSTSQEMLSQSQQEHPHLLNFGF